MADLVGAVDQGTTSTTAGNDRTRRDVRNGLSLRVNNLVHKLFSISGRFRQSVSVPM
jgi:hypothetical protein